MRDIKNWGGGAQWLVTFIFAKLYHSPQHWWTPLLCTFFSLFFALFLLFSGLWQKTWKNITMAEWKTNKLYSDLTQCRDHCCCPAPFILLRFGKRGIFTRSPLPWVFKTLSFFCYHVDLPRLPYTCNIGQISLYLTHQVTI